MLQNLLQRSLPVSLVAALLADARAQAVASYHGVSSATHQTQFNTLSQQGYRMVSVSVAGSISAPVYSAVWQQSTGPAWVASHDMSPAQYATFRTQCINQGFRCKLVTAAGTSASTAVFAAMFVNDGLTVYDSHTFSESTFLDLSAFHRQSGNILVCADLHGGAGYGPYVCAVFEPNPTNTVWGCHIDGSAAEFNETRAAHGDGGVRLAAIGMSETQRYVSVWYDQKVGTETVAANQTGAGWQNVFNAATATQHHRTIASGGSGSALRFAGSFSQYQAPLIRTNATTGVYRSQFAAFDAYMQSLLAASGARAGALAMSKDGKLVYARGFTRAEAGYPVTEPDDLFRLGSLTKVFNAVATYEAKELGLLQLTERPQAILNLPFTAAGFDNIQVRHVLEYISGTQRPYSATEIANAMSVSLPISLATGTAWLDDQVLLFPPPVGAGTTSSFAAYSNTSWMLTAECIRVRSGSPYMTFLRNNVLLPLSVPRAKVAPSELAQLGPDDVFPHLNWLHTATTELDNSGTRVSQQFSEDLNFKRASGGMASSAIDYVRFLSGVFDLQGADAIVLDDAAREDALDPHTFVSFENPNTTERYCRASMVWSVRPNGVRSYRKGGGLESTSAEAGWRTDGVSWAVLTNIGNAEIDTLALNTLIDGVASWPNVDEFPSYGMPAFQQRPRIETITPANLFTVNNAHFTVTGKRMDTVIRVEFGGHQITSTSPANWADGWFDIVSPTELHVYPPQGRMPGTFSVRCVNSVGTGNGEAVDLVLGPAFRIGAPATVGGGPWACCLARGTASGLPLSSSFAILCVSFSNLPSSVPGVINLGLGNQFTDLVTTGIVPFGAFTSAIRFDFALLPSGTVFLEGAALDFALSNPFPAPTTSTISVTRQ